MSNPSVYQLLVEGRISDNIRATKRLFNTVLEQARSDKSLFENQFMKINETHNIDCADVKKGFSSVSASLREAKELIQEASKEKSKSNLKKAQELIKKAHKKLKEAETLTEANVDSFYSVVTIAEGLENKKKINERVEVVDDNFMLCVDCAQAVANDDFSGLDYHYDEEEAEQREREIRESMHKLNQKGYFIAMGDSDKDQEFSKQPCELCSSHLAGYRHHANLLKK